MNLISDNLSRADSFENRSGNKNSDTDRFLRSGLDKGAGIFFVGIGGISMSGLAELSLHYGYRVGGSDMHSSNRTDLLRQKGIRTFIGHSANSVQDFAPDLVVHTAAVLPGNPEILFARENGIPVVTRAEFLGHLTNGFSRVINISGTHGKTTTTSMLSLILIESGLDPTVHLGAEFDVFNGTVRLGADHSLLVSEACEYQRSFLHFRSTTAAITNIDYDHVDCYDGIDEVINVFAAFSDKLEDSGFLVMPAFDVNSSLCYRQIRKRRLDASRPMPTLITTGLEGDVFPETKQHADIFAKNIVYRDGLPEFDVWNRDRLYARISLSVPGKHNIYNALTAIACAIENGGTPEGAVRALNSFRGAEGRFSIKGTYHGAKIVTDYAHHPTAAKATLQAASEIPHKKLWVVFQPLTFNRTEKLFEDYVSVLLSCDHIIFAEIFSDREIDPGTVSSSMLADAINQRGGRAEYYADKKAIIKRLDSLVGNDDLVLFLGPEDIRELADELEFD
ncbi:MAG: UDP-N-acetylmuramate--L-alanine ligase [Clostridiales bacterium]|nr:UDP-N-acetylmuramate--L-alanine ligase [Clostridiales bacterium]